MVFEKDFPKASVFTLYFWWILWYTETKRWCNMFFIGVILLFLAACFFCGWRVSSYLKVLFPNTPKRKLAVLVSSLLSLFTLAFVLSLVAEIPIVEAIGAVFLGIFINLFLFVLLGDIVGLVLKLACKNRVHKRAKLIQSVSVLLFSLLLSGYGFINAGVVTVKEYSLTLEKPLTPLRIAMLSDLHLGSVGSEAYLENWVEKINEEKPDIVLVAGDLIDSDFDKIEDPDRAAKLLASIKSKYGVYASLGNHDAGKTFSDMLAFFDSANITVLRDEHTVIDSRFVIAGRRDASPIGGTLYGDKRKDTASFLDEIDSALPVIVMDHNPQKVDEYDGRADLILSGHTHKGQVFPAGFITKLLYTVDYGLYQNNADSPYVIVSSGIYGWGMPMKTSGHSELVVITLQGKDV